MNRVNVVVTIDDDDTNSLEFIKWYDRQDLIKVKWRVVKRTYRLNMLMNQACIENGADFYWGLNADIEFKTYHWDLILDPIVNARKDKFTVFYCDDDIDEPFCCFPAVNHKYMEYMKCLIPPELDNQAADGVLWQLVRGFNCIVDVPIKLWHFKHTGRISQKIIDAQDRVNITVKGHLEKNEVESYHRRIISAQSNETPHN